MAMKDKDSLRGHIPEWLVFGTEGKSAYQVAVENGYEGTVEQWLASLIGPRGIGIRNVTIVQSSASGGKSSIVFELDDGSDCEMHVRNGLDGADGVGKDGLSMYLFNPQSETYNGYYSFHAVTLPAGRRVQMGDLLLAPNGDVYSVTKMTMTTFLPTFRFSFSNGSGGNADQSGLSAAAAELLVEILRNGVYSNDQSANITALAAELAVAEEEEPDTPVEPDEPVTPEKTLSSISATYSGGDVAVGTAVTALTGIVVTAHYSDGTSETVTGYTLSGTIAEGSNTITVSYGGKTTTFTVTGVAESGGAELTLVSLGSSTTVTTLYSDAGETAIVDWSVNARVNQWYVDTIFDVDTEVTIAVLYGIHNANLKQYACCVSSLESTDGYYAETIGHAQAEEYTYKYTVRAGHYLRILNYNTGSPTSITVTK